MKRFRPALAIILGVIGVAIAVVAMFFTVRLAIGVADVASSLTGTFRGALIEVESQATAIAERLDANLAEGATDGAAVEARADAFAGSVNQALQGLQSFQDTPLVGALPVGDGDLNDVLISLESNAGELASWAESLPDRLDSASEQVRLEARSEIERVIGEIQQRVANASQEAEELNDRVERWILIGAIVIVLLLAWAGLGQWMLVLWGWRTIRPSKGRHAADATPQQD